MSISLTILLIYSFIHGLFNNSVNSSDYKVSKGMVITKQLIGKYLEGSSHDLIWSNTSAIAWRDWGKTQ